MKPAIKALKIARRAAKKIGGCEAVICRCVDGTIFRSDVFELTLGETDTQETFDNGIVISTRLRDFLIDADQYRINGVENGECVKPECGDVIKVCLASGESQFKVIPGDGQDRAYERADLWGCVWRIHTKEIFNDKGW